MSFFSRSIKMPNWAFLIICLFLGIGLPVIFPFTSSFFNHTKEAPIQIKTGDTCINKNHYLQLEDHSIPWQGDDKIIFTFRKLQDTLGDEVAHEVILKKIEKGDYSIGQIAPIFKTTLFSVGDKKHEYTDRIMRHVLKELVSETANGPEHAGFVRAQIVYLRGAFLYESNSLTYSPWHWEWDKKLLEQEKRFQDFQFSLASKKIYPENKN